MHIDYLNLISVKNLFQAWDEFRKGKSKRLDVQIFERDLENNLFDLQQRLKTKSGYGTQALLDKLSRRE